MQAIMKNGHIVTGRLADIFVSQKVAEYLEEADEEEEIVANEEEQVQPKSKVSYKKVVKKKAGRPKKK